MVGLSILLEGQKNSDKGPVINKAIVVKTSPPLTNSSSMPSSLYSPSPSPAITFLDSCFLCKQRLLPGQDIFMYKGGAFCSEECRYRQIFIDETESNRRKYCSLSDMNVQVKPSPSSSSASSRHSHRRETRNRAGRFAW